MNPGMPHRLPSLSSVRLSLSCPGPGEVRPIGEFALRPVEDRDECGSIGCRSLGGGGDIEVALGGGSDVVTGTHIGIRMG